MAGNSETEVCCCFCGKWLPIRDAVRIAISAEKMETESQILFGHRACLVSVVHPIIPMHPDLLSDSTTEAH